MMSATLFREGPDLDTLLAELDTEFPGRVQVVDVEYGRSGGVMGFFAHRRLGVHYRLVDETADVTMDVTVDERVEARVETPLEDLLAAADAADSRGASAVAAPAADEPTSDQVEFARMLLEL